MKWLGEWLHAHLQDCICTLTMSACLNTCQSVCLVAHVHGSAWGPANEWKMEKKVLSISAAWAGSWWKQEGGRLAGRSHALFRHHSDGAQPLGQNTTWFLGTLTRATLEKPGTSIRTSPSYSNCSTSTIVGKVFCLVHSKQAEEAVSLLTETDSDRPTQFSFGTRSANMWNALASIQSSKKINIYILDWKFPITELKQY